MNCFLKYDIPIHFPAGMLIKMTALVILAVLFQVPVIAFEQESEHPPLSENTKRAIADYKRSPTGENRNMLLKTMNESYDAVIQLKKDKLAERIRDREKNINRWMQSVRSGEVPPFMKLNTENHKGNERKAIAETVNVYRKNPSVKNENAVKTALAAYYDAFLEEQKKHIRETEDSREARLAVSLARFTSERFRPGLGVSKSTVKQEDALAEIICSYISVGAEIVPVNPEARVRERGFNSAINTAQAHYLNDPTGKKRAALKTEIAKAFQAACKVRFEEIARAEKKGLAGGGGLFEQIKKPDFRGGQFRELTQQRNLYGRIDRIITFGGNSVGNWEPRMKTESRELAKLLQEHEKSPGRETEQAVREKFNDIYEKMLNIQKRHLKAMETKLDFFIEETLKELAD